MARFEIPAEIFERLLEVPPNQTDRIVMLMESAIGSVDAMVDFERYFSLFRLDEFAGFVAADEIADCLYPDDEVRAEQLLDGAPPSRDELLEFAQLKFREQASYPFDLGTTVWGHEFACGSGSMFLLFDLTDTQFLDLADMFLGRYRSLEQARDALVGLGVEL